MESLVRIRKKSSSVSKKKGLYIKTFGCQMNEYDSEKMAKILEEDYEALRLDLTESGDDKRVIYAMITNFQNRIDLLQNVLEKIEEIKQLKQNSDENATTL